MVKVAAKLAARNGMHSPPNPKKMPRILSMVPRASPYKSETSALVAVFSPPPPAPISKAATAAEARDVANAKPANAAATIAAERTSTTLLPKRSIVGPAASDATKMPK